MALFSIEEIALILCLHYKLPYGHIHYLGYNSRHFSFNPNSVTSHVRLWIYNNTRNCKVPRTRPEISQPRDTGGSLTHPNDEKWPKHFQEAFLSQQA